MLERIIPFAHNKIKEYVTKNDTVIDMTAGNGNDTLFLSTLAKQVFAFDIQKEAIDKTNELLEFHQINNVTTIHDSHINLKKYINTRIQCAVFNLGYLPKGDKSITTKASTTLEALDTLLPMMNIDGLISITVYIGHKNGLEESNQLQSYVSTLSSKKYNVLQYANLNKQNAPYNIFIEKIGE